MCNEEPPIEKQTAYSIRESKDKSCHREWTEEDRCRRGGRHSSQHTFKYFERKRQHECYIVEKSKEQKVAENDVIWEGGWSSPRRFADAYEGTEDALNVLVSYEKPTQSLLAKHVQARVTDLLASKYICHPLGCFLLGIMFFCASFSFNNRYQWLSQTLNHTFGASLLCEYGATVALSMSLQ